MGEKQCYRAANGQWWEIETEVLDPDAENIVKAIAGEPYIVPTRVTITSYNSKREFIANGGEWVETCEMLHREEQI